MWSITLYSLSKSTPYNDHLAPLQGGIGAIHLHHKIFKPLNGKWNEPKRINRKNDI